MPRDRAFIFADDTNNTVTVISALRADAKLDLSESKKKFARFHTS